MYSTSCNELISALSNTVTFEKRPDRWDWQCCVVYVTLKLTRLIKVFRVEDSEVVAINGDSVLFGRIFLENHRLTRKGVAYMVLHVRKVIMLRLFFCSPGVAMTLGCTFRRVNVVAPAIVLVGYLLLYRRSFCQGQSASCRSSCCGYNASIRCPVDPLKDHQRAPAGSDSLCRRLRCIVLARRVLSLNDSYQYLHKVRL